MKKTLKGPATAFFVLSLVFVVAWLAVFALHGLLAKEINFDFAQFYDLWLKPRIEYAPEFFQGKVYGFAPADGDLFYMTYVGFGALGIMEIGRAHV